MANFFRDGNHYQSTLRCLWKWSQEPWETLNYNRHSNVHITETVLYSPIVGKGGNLTSQGFNYTHPSSHWKWLACSGIRKTRWYKKSSPWVTKTLQTQLCSVFHEEENIWEQIFMCSLFVHTWLHKNAPCKHWHANHSCSQTHLFSAGTSRLPAATFSVHWSVYTKFNTVKNKSLRLENRLQ